MRVWIMDIPPEGRWFLGAIAVLFIAFSFMTMLVVYDAATKASEFFDREKEERQRREQSWPRE